MRDEIIGGDDRLAEWVSALGKGFFLPAEAATVGPLGTVAQWVNQQDEHTPAAKNTFLQVADYYLLAQALAGEHIVVTHEKPENSRHRVKIPNVCLGFGVRHLNTFDMLRREGARFILGAKPEAGSTP